jgi:CheY-like chemotaxis protein
VVSNVEGICRRTFDRGIRIRAELGDVPPVDGDSLQLEQVVLNLCINARDALEEGGTDGPLVCLSSEAVDVDETTAPEGIGHGSFVRLRIRDNGPGIDAETRKRIFEPFFTTKDVDRGTGLGLSTALGIVQDHGGWIECDSQEGAGTVFDLYFPESTSAPAPVETSPADSDTSGTETVLVIDDEEMVRHTAVKLLRRQGYTMLSAADGEEGLDLFERHGETIDLILLDQSMPRLSGKQALARLRAQSTSVGIVIITGFPVDLEDFEGADDLLQKPFSLKSLADCVRRTLDRDR